MTRSPLTILLPGRRPVFIRDLVLDFNGTLALDGHLLPGVKHRLGVLGGRLRVTVLTADTFGTARQALGGLAVEVRIVKTGADKARLVRALGAARVVAIGNGRNDVAMCKAAALGLAVVGPEGAAGGLVRVADVVCLNIHDALDLLLHPLRLKATLRI